MFDLKLRTAAMVRRAQIMVNEPNNVYTKEGYVIWITQNTGVRFVDPNTGQFVNPS